VCTGGQQWPLVLAKDASPGPILGPAGPAASWNREYSKKGDSRGTRIVGPASAASAPHQGIRADVGQHDHST